MKPFQGPYPTITLLLLIKAILKPQFAEETKLEYQYDLQTFWELQRKQHYSLHPQHHSQILHMPLRQMEVTHVHYHLHQMSLN